MEIIRDILTSNGGAASIVLGLLWLAFWTVKKLATISADHNNLSKSIASIDGIRTDVAEIRGNINFLLTSKDPVAERQSPVRLTELGNEVVDELGIKGMLGSKWDALYSKIKAQNLNNAYDIQEFCNSLASNLEAILSNEDLVILKTDAFNRGWPLLHYQTIIGILLRDKYFELEGIDVEEVDKHDPGQAAAVS